jgi:hypothetical protein
LAITFAKLPFFTGQAVHPHGLSFAFLPFRSFVCFPRCALSAAPRHFRLLTLTGNSMADRTHTERINFGKLREVIQPPNLIEIQITSYLDFLQKGIPEKQRKPQGLEAVFREVFPILSYDERLTLEYVSYTILASPRTPRSSASAKASPTRCRST